ncbi:MAG: 2-C-methyl-D-erythritol 4-phosphate cytidylyltransferase [Deltaproteobacteria bacterium CG23_combo_of_CG06-09_8_20_14_all_51_20]|nr:2-C-methyl-D-erythritol 4-phosphate cytidylyltransferase [bacterium]NCP07850.1 2-C-methyl-D-erythritol 4-phosphate cytidylyltransferase [bacterium]PIP45528.1 MAG: 2-C-methyl-D-erythritol 4-phosphate cytidylyltransferase [Deltaproteobacteria bacterium CG23_combo_of_CG06-09_8_20_14_all_51_20]PIY26662.1 MAG: 2-C-methyl-D-erythritol 4-phosphate cytidylyltransferase [Deltaproteobacteria bacterium CG_4_10_14_3_um_filter_51_14]PJB39416.1 MAG: 2-C-methyl-D-erythritol 4-phosphate cytidylyltransferase
MNAKTAKKPRGLRSASDEGGVAAIIPAAGSGLRMGLDLPKQFLKVEGVPLLSMTLRAFQDCPLVDSIFLVVPSDDIEYAEREIVRPFGLSKVCKVIAGGALRHQSVLAGLEATEGRYPFILVHDGVRPLVDAETISEVIKTGKKFQAVTVGYPAADTIKEINANHEVVRTLDRRGLWLVQTPQFFRYSDLIEAHRKADKEHWEDVTDDCLLVERLGIKVRIVVGPRNNIKMTYPEDKDLLPSLLSSRASKIKDN